MCVSIFALLLACSGSGNAPTPAHEKHEAASAPHDREDPHPALPKIVRLSPRVLADAKIKTARAAKEELRLTLALPGEIAADPDKTARISSPVAGRIQQVGFREGSTVEKGDMLAVIRVPELGKIRAAYDASQEKAKAARANAERTKALVDERLGAQQAYLDARAAADALEIEARSIGEQLAAIGAQSSAGRAFELTLRAPLSGVVLARDAVVGQPVTADQVLGSIADLSEVWFLGRVFEKDLGRLAEGASAEVELNAYADERFAGTVEYIGRQVDPGARTVTARIRLENQGELLRIGLFGTAHVSTGEKQSHVPLIVVPRSALTEIGGKSVVFVRHGDGSFEIHEVSAGDAALGKVEIVSGLREGEDIVVDGVFTLKSVVLKGAFGDDD
jgi:cobalt-zinc-cadmium efflux system membrane fusion protein